MFGNRTGNEDLDPKKDLGEEASHERLRRFSRQTVNIRAFLHFGGRFQSVVIRDLSLGGAGIKGAVGVIPGDEVSIEFLDGRKISGAVKWWLAGNCGVAFHNVLEESDPLMRKRDSLRKYVG